LASETTASGLPNSGENPKLVLSDADLGRSTLEDLVLARIAARRRRD